MPRYDRQEEILSHDADLLRELAAARGFGVHDDRVRRDRALQADVRVRRGVSHGHRRARGEYRTRGGEGREFARRAGGSQSEDFRRTVEAAGDQYTHFIRTTSTRACASGAESDSSHACSGITGCQREKRSIYKAKYEGRYCIYDNLYVSDTPEPADCPNCGRPGELVSEDNYFFRLSAYQDKLLELYKKPVRNSCSRISGSMR